MAKKKVTLSIEDRIYKNFQKYCNTNAINLSKVIEIFMDDFFRKKKIKLSFVLLIILIFNLSFGSAVTIFSDDFESGTLGGWSLTAASGANNWTNSLTDPFQGTRHAQSQPQSTTEPASVIERGISTLGYQNITLKYKRKLIALDVADEFQVEWNDGAGWIILEQTGGSSADDSSYVFSEFNFSTNANNNPNFRIKFECTAGAVSEFCRVDNVELLGNTSEGNPDTTPPAVNLISPANGTTTQTNTSYFAANFIDNIRLKNATLFLWNSTGNLIGTNFTNISGTANSTNLSFALPYQGTFFWNYRVFDNSSNGAFNNTNFSLIYTIPDTTPPYFTTIPSDPSIEYPNGFSVDFDALDNVAIDSYSINWTSLFVINQSGYLKNITTLPAGTYNINVTINDTSNNLNSTIWVLTVNKAPGNISLLLNSLGQNQTSAYGNTTNASASSLYGSITLYRNGLNVASGNNQPVILGAGNYNYTAVSSGDENHSQATITRWVHIIRATSSCSISSNSPQEYSSPINVTGNCNNPEAPANLYRNNVQVNGENGQDKILGAGSYNYIINVSETQNYTSANNTALVILNQNSTYTLAIFGTTPIEYPQTTDVSGNNCPAELSCSLDKSNGVYGAGSVTFNYSTPGNSNYTSNSITKEIILNQNSSYGLLLSVSPGSGTYPLETMANGSSCPLQLICNLYRDSSLKSNPEIITLGAGSYNYNYNTTGNSNYTSKSLSVLLIITQNTSSSVSLFLNNSQNNLTIENGTSILINASLNVGEGIIELYKNNILINVGNSPIFNNTLFDSIGFRNITVIYPGNANYSSVSKTLFVNVTLPPANIPPIVNSNYTIVNGSIKIPIYGETFFVRVNASDPENDIKFVNFTIISSNGSAVINNLIGSNYSIGGNLIWESGNYTVDDYGFWNWSSLLFDGANFVQQNGTFRVLSELNVFPSSYIATPDPKNQTLIWNLSIYHQSNEDYVFSFSHVLNSTFFNLTFMNNSATISKKNYNESNLFNTQIRIEISNNVLENLVYDGSITITRQFDGRNYTVPIRIGINPPSGNIDAFDLSELKCSGGNCNADVKMENDESRSFSWIIRNTGNHSLSGCLPNVTGFDISNFGAFSNSNFNLSINESTTLSLTLDKPSINSYYGQLEILCKATAQGFNTSLGAESENAPRLKILVVADSGGGTLGVGNGGGGGGRSVVLIQENKRFGLNISDIKEIKIERGTKKNFAVEVINTGGLFLNNCKARFEGESREWLANEQVKGLGAGEKFVLDIELEIPRDAEPKDYNSSIAIECSEGRASRNFVIDVFRNVFEAQISDYEKVEDSLRVEYGLKENAGIEHNIILEYSLVDLNGLIRYSGRESLFLGAGEEKNNFVEFVLPKDSFGEFEFNMKFVEGNVEIVATRTIFLPSQRGLAGLVFSGGTRGRLSLIGLIAVFLLILFFVTRFIYSHHKRIKKIGELGKREKRKLIKFEI
ncbi:hypothetical protein HYV50_05285 [Candidatus Pacearchaeota archaeon]|nr:hypothetical protein [Candidatus Pacearchaeota archaeon]